MCSKTWYTTSVVMKKTCPICGMLGARELNFPMNILLSVVAAILTAIFLWFLREISKWINKGTAALPPGPRGLPLVGYLPFLSSNLHHSFTDLSKLYGPIFKFWLGSKLCVVVSSPSLVKEVLKEQDATFADRDLNISGSVLSYGGNDIAFAAYGPDWRNSRKIFVREIMSRAKIDASYAIRREEVGKTISEMYGRIGTPIEISEFTFRTAFNSTTRMLWGGALEEYRGGENGIALAAEFRTAIGRLSVLLAKLNASDVLPALAWLDLQGIERETKKFTLWEEQVFDFVIEKKRRELARGSQSAKKEKDFLQLLVEQLSGNTDSGTMLNLRQVKAMLTDIVFGATDTTTSTVEWAMTEMMKHPKIFEKVNEELTDVVGMNNVVEEFHLPELKYLNAVVKETLRLHHIVPLLVPRNSTKSSTVGGYHIPKGTKIYVNAWSVHSDPSIWDNPLEFQPERFLISNSGKFNFLGTNFEYLPFGSGRRMCPAVALGERMLVYMLASFLHSFDWKLPEGAEVDLAETFGIVTKKSTSLVVIPTPRFSNSEVSAWYSQQC